MPLFGFGDISFNKGSSQRKGPLASLVGSDFETSTLRYPIDLGSFDKGHYVVFYIREQKRTSAQFQVGRYASEVGKSGFSDVTKSSTVNITSLTQNPQALATNFGNELMGKINSGLNQINQSTGGNLGGITSQISKVAGGAIGGIVGGVNNLFGQAGLNFGGSSGQTTAVLDQSIKRISNKSFVQTTRLTKDAIALYMPDTLLFNYSQSYDQKAIGGEALGKIAGAGRAAIEAFQKAGESGDTGAAIKAAAGSAGVSLGETIVQAGGQALGRLAGSEGSAQVALAALGRVQNPMLELIYTSPNFRTFQFDFLFYPRDERESLEVQKILERFRFHQAPEMLQGGFLVPPAEFDIKFYYRGAENNNIPQIATCVLTTIDMNYAPNGWSAYEVPGENNPSLGRTGMPVAIQLTLQFQEVTYLTKADYRFGGLGEATAESKISNRNPNNIV
jgi:hypothetical protein